jgi:hypothetical protein
MKVQKIIDKNNIKEKTEEETLEEQKRSTWEAFKNFKYDDLTPDQRENLAYDLYETLATKPTPPTMDIPFDFWKEYEDTDEIREVNKYKTYVERILENLPEHPSKDTWLDRERGIIPTMKREWKAKLEPFRNERILKEKLRHVIEKFVNLPENKNKSMTIDGADMFTKAVTNIEETAYKPVRATIEKIEEEIKKRVQ